MTSTISYKQSINDVLHSTFLPSEAPTYNYPIFFHFQRLLFQITTISTLRNGSTFFNSSSSGSRRTRPAFPVLSRRGVDGGSRWCVCPLVVEAGGLDGVAGMKTVGRLEAATMFATIRTGPLGNSKRGCTF